MPDIFSQDACTQSGIAGFVSIAGLPQQAFNRAPSAKQRMRILKRDDCKCRICGRRPENQVDVELDVHHIRPWGKGGLTEDENLITLCHTCHKGLEPHDDPSPFLSIGLLDTEGVKHSLAVSRYRRFASSQFEHRENIE